MAKEGCINFSHTGRNLGKVYEAHVPPFRAEFSASADMQLRKEGIHRERHNLQVAAMQLGSDIAQTKNMKSPQLRRRAKRLCTNFKIPSVPAGQCADLNTTHCGCRDIAVAEKQKKLTPYRVTLTATAMSHPASLC